MLVSCYVSAHLASLVHFVMKTSSSFDKDLVLVMTASLKGHSAALGLKSPLWLDGNRLYAGIQIEKKHIETVSQS